VTTTDPQAGDPEAAEAADSPAADSPAVLPHIQPRLRQSVDGLRKVAPEFSAHARLSRQQRRVLLATGAAVALSLGLATRITLIVLVALLMVVYLWGLAFRLKLFRLSLRSPEVATVSDDDARAVPDADLPVYTVLVPAFQEPEVIGPLLDALGRLDYPRDRLDVKLLLEEEDAETIGAAILAGAATRVDLVIVPTSQPRTKPKALNYGLTVARGSLVTIYDAEDRPEPLQLRRAAVAFSRSTPQVACLQAKLSYFNPDQNLITRWFAVEYAMWFSQMLPGLARVGAPVPLGGTSNHVRRSVLVRAGGWDPYNVTEDADLGIRLHRLGYRTAVLDSTTLEEANSDFVNWAKQRSRWYKGYLQTWLVHTRRPRLLWSQLGPAGTARFSLFVAGTPLLALINPLFWTLTALWFTAQPAFVTAMLPAPVYYASLLCWLGGNFLFAYAFIVTALEMDRPELVLAAALSPLYWVMMSIAAIKAAIQLVTDPFYWEKTQHGLDALATRRRAQRKAPDVAA
jgi:cellulose synthase/poly-beta-1,6-N-acetylglucosamine synthase-like glycosyltransferase